MRTLTLAFLCLLVAPWCMAQGVAGSVEVTPLAGYWFGDTLVRGRYTVPEVFNYDVAIDDAAVYGARIAYRFTPHWALEGTLARSRPNLVSDPEELFVGPDRLGPVGLTTAELGVEGAFGHRRVVPFVTGGIGGMNFDPSDTSVLGPGSTTRFVGYAGGGFKIFFSPAVALRLDARFHEVDLGGRDYPCTYRGCIDNNKWITFKEVSAGVTFVL